MTTIVTKFSVGDTCYVVVHPTADILQCIVDYVRVVPVTTTLSTVTYNVHRTVNIVGSITTLQYVKEAELYTFAEAKAELLAWLEIQRLKTVAATEPVIV